MAGGPGLFEAMTGHFANGVPVEEFDLATQTFLSVQDNIQRILNSRRGEAGPPPDYGLGDLSRIYRHLPHRRTRSSVVQVTLLRYRAELRGIDIDIDDTEPGCC